MSGTFRGTRAPAPSSADAEARLKAQRTRDTKLERILRSKLHRLGLRYRLHRVFPGTRRKADLVFVRARVAVLVDGCFWHGCREHGTWPKANAAWWRAKIKGNRVRDVSTNQLLTAAGWVVSGRLAADEAAARSSRGRTSCALCERHRVRRLLPQILGRARQDAGVESNLVQESKASELNARQRAAKLL